MKIQLLFLVLLTSLMTHAQTSSWTIDQSFDDLKNQPGTSYFEVSSEMFQMLSESEMIGPELKEYYRKLTKIKMINYNKRNNTHSSFDFYKSFLKQTNLKDFVRLVVSEREGDNLSFYKKKNSKEENEFLLVGSTTVIYVCGTIDLKSVHEFEQIIGIAGTAIGD